MCFKKYLYPKTQSSVCVAVRLVTRKYLEKCRKQGEMCIHNILLADITSECFLHRIANNYSFDNNKST